MVRTQRSVGVRTPRPGAGVLGLMLLALLAPPGCLPSRVVIDLAPSDGALVETVVLEDPGAGRAKIALIDVVGLIAHTPAPRGLFTGRANAVDALVARLDEAADDPDVAGVLLRINSPGGTVAASQTVFEEVEAFRERTGKPVVVSMADVAASGGYYLALAGDHIMAQPASVTGSVGVIMQTFNVSRGMEMIGFEGRTLVSRPNKDLANPFEPPEEEHYAILQGLVDGFYQDFRDLVLARRELPPEVHGPALDGRVFTGRQALDLGLIDALGTLRDAYAKTKSLAGVDAARLVKHHAEGLTPATPYAAALGLDAGGGDASEINLIQLELPQPIGATAGFYYLWRP